MTELEQVNKRIGCLKMRIEADAQTIERLKKKRMDIKRREEKKALFEVLMRSICSTTKYTREEILSHDKALDLSFCRIIIAGRMSSAGFGPTEIGRALHRSHSNAIYLRDRYTLETSDRFHEINNSIKP